MSCSVGKAVSYMIPSPDTLLQVATGGKENDLKVWDGNNPTAPVFQAKNVSMVERKYFPCVSLTHQGWVGVQRPAPRVLSWRVHTV
jgi:ribosome biogenesis protein NSA1